jgi:DNA modification methylase
MTKTSSFGTSKREGHDSVDFYKRNLYGADRGDNLGTNEAEVASYPNECIPDAMAGDWVDRIYCQSSESMPLPGESVALALTSPPYNVGKDYDDDISMPAYLDLIRRTGKEVYRVLKPGGRYVINIANLGRKPYIPLHAYFYNLHQDLGFLPMGEIIWQKGKGANGNCAWGSWKSARAPRLRDIHEYLLVFAKGGFSRSDKGSSDITDEEFMEATLSIWNIPPESARKIGHPAPFPIALAARVIRLYSYIGDVVLDPFAGSGTTCVAAAQLERHYVGFDISPDYCKLAEERISVIMAK